MSDQLKKELADITELNKANNYRSQLLNFLSDKQRKTKRHPHIASRTVDGQKWVGLFTDKDWTELQLKRKDSDGQATATAVLTKTKAGTWSGQMSTTEHPEPFNTRAFLKHGWSESSGNEYTFINLYTEPYESAETVDEF